MLTPSGDRWHRNAASSVSPVAAQGLLEQRHVPHSAARPQPQPRHNHAAWLSGDPLTAPPLPRIPVAAAPHRPPTSAATRPPLCARALMPARAPPPSARPRLRPPAISFATPISPPLHGQQPEPRPLPRKLHPHRSGAAAPSAQPPASPLELLWPPWRRATRPGTAGASPTALAPRLQRSPAQLPRGEHLLQRALPELGATLQQPPATFCAGHTSRVGVRRQRRFLPQKGRLSHSANACKAGSSRFPKRRWQRPAPPGRREHLPANVYVGRNDPVAVVLQGRPSAPAGVLPHR
mmetsp:Transcript_34707/g.73989  ORF Transcript_34707/g.73989 Transcript_34707/m.73989 type:complete len:293 (-) Transcript_34707:2074-2952(-)